jgi:hypothetical protein
MWLLRNKDQSLTLSVSCSQPLLLQAEKLLQNDAFPSSMLEKSKMHQAELYCHFQVIEGHFQAF